MAEFNDKLISTVQSIIEDVYSTYCVEQVNLAADLASQVSRRVATLNRNRDVYRDWANEGSNKTSQDFLLKLSPDTEEGVDESTLEMLNYTFPHVDQTPVIDGYSHKQPTNHEVRNFL